MKGIKIYIPLTILSVLLIIFGINSLFTPPSNSTKSFEHEQVIHRSLNISFEDKEFLKTYFPNTFSSSKQWLLLFVSEASNCSNCLNEVNDYIELSNSFAPLKNHYTSLLIYHGSDSLRSTRFAKTSDISSIVDEIAFMYSSTLSKLTISKFSQNYTVESFLFLIDKNESKVFHVFYLPQRNTTKFSNKEIAFSNAILNYIDN